jgi:hypothetical protein
VKATAFRNEANLDRYKAENQTVAGNANAAGDILKGAAIFCYTSRRDILMARIQEYQGQTEVGGPQRTREAKESDTGNIGDAFHSLGETISKTADKFQERIAEAEVSDLTAKMAQRHADITQGLDEALAQPGAEDDPDFASKFMEKYDAQMSDLTNSAKSPQAARYMEKANAMMPFAVPGERPPQSSASRRRASCSEHEHDDRLALNECDQQSQYRGQCSRHGGSRDRPPSFQHP